MKTINRLINKIKEILHTPINNQKGIVLPIILMAIGGLSLIGAAAISVTTGEIGISNNDKLYKAALNLAESGIADANDGIQGNRSLVPQPIGSVTSASYSFNTALASGRYLVTIELPVVTSLTADSAQSTTTVVVSSTNNLGPGDPIIIGNTTIHMMAKIGSIDKNTNTLSLLDSQDKPYRLPYNATVGMLVAKNTIRITSTGQSGTGLAGGALAAWRDPNIIPGGLAALPTGGIIRSAVTLQADYSMQEIQIFNSFDAGQVNNPGNKFNGPILVTQDLTVNNYTKGDYSGPIFLSGPNATANFTPVSGTQTPLPSTNPMFPKAVKIPLVTTTATTMLNQAAANATCYQKQCSVAGADQQIYYLNGYEINVLAYRPTTPGTLNFPFSIDDEVVLSGNYIVFNVILDRTITMGSADNLTINLSTTTNPATLSSSDNVTTSSISVSYAPGTNGTINLTGGNITFQNNQTYVAGTTITIWLPTTGSNAPGTTGEYVRVYDNSPNQPGFGSAGWSNGVWISPLGNVESAEKQGDINTYPDSGANSHANHNIILTTEPLKEMRGVYAQTDSASNSSSAWTTNGKGAVLFGSRKANGSGWVVGDTATYQTSYYIHTNAVGSCNDHDIKITSMTKVTYLGISTKCSDTDKKKLFFVETIWNHTPTNTSSYQFGEQPDDNDPKLGVIPHKGYFKWVKSKDSADNEFIRPDVLIGDKEFVSVFNHSSDNRFHSSVINANISDIRMIGWANPPIKFDTASSTMAIAPASFGVVAFKMPVNASSANSWDWPDMVGTRSSFILWPTIKSNGISTTKGYDFTDFSIASGSIVPYTINGNSILPDMSDVNAVTTTANNTGTGNVDLYQATSTPVNVAVVSTNNNTVPTGYWVAGGTWSSPMIGGTTAMPGSPLMDPNALPLTTITSTISGPTFTRFSIRRGSANLFFDAANGIPFNVSQLTIETKGAGANISIGSQTNPATVFAGQFELKSEDCGGTINFSFVGKMVAGQVEFEKNVKYNIDTTITSGTCLSTGSNYIYLKKQSWKEVRN